MSSSLRMIGIGDVFVGKTTKPMLDDTHWSLIDVAVAIFVVYRASIPFGPVSASVRTLGCARAVPVSGANNVVNASPGDALNTWVGPRSSRARAWAALKLPPPVSTNDSA